MSMEIQKAKKLDIRSYIQSDTVKNQIALVLPKHLTADRMARVVCTAILKTPKLLECTPESLLQAMMLCSQAGLEPDGRNAHLIPYGNTVQVIFDYKGLIALAERNGVKNIRAVSVCEKDEFDFSIEDGNPKLHHVINWKADRGAAYAYYGTCIRNDQFDVEVMTKAEVDRIRQRSRASGSGPWVTDYDEMAKKTVLRRMSKRWDITPEAYDALTNELDNASERQQQPSKAAVASPINLPEQAQEAQQAQDGAGQTSQPPTSQKEAKAAPAPAKAQEQAIKEPVQTVEPASDPAESAQQPAESQASQPTESDPSGSEAAAAGQAVQKPEDMDAATCVAIITDNANAGGVTMTQVLTHLVGIKLAKADQKISDLSTQKLQRIVANWPTLLPKIQAVAKG